MAQSDNVAQRMKAHLRPMDALVAGGELKAGPRCSRGFLREAKLAGQRPDVASAGAGLGTDMLSSKEVRGGSRTSARGAKFIRLSGEEMATARHGRGLRRRVTAKPRACLAWQLRRMRPAPRLNWRKHRPRRSLPSTRPQSPNAYGHKVMHEMARGDADATMAAPTLSLDVAERNGLRITRVGSHGTIWAWARRAAGADELAQFRGPRRDIIGQRRSDPCADVSRSARGTRSRTDVRGRGA